MPFGCSVSLCLLIRIRVYRYLWLIASRLIFACAIFLVCFGFQLLGVSFVIAAVHKHAMAALRVGNTLRYASQCAPLGNPSGYYAIQTFEPVLCLGRSFFCSLFLLVAVLRRAISE